MSRGILTFGGYDSDYLGIYITGAAVYNAPERDVTMVEVPGRSGDLCLDNGRWRNVTVTYPAFTYGDMETVMRRIRNALAEESVGGYFDLSDSYNPDEHRLAVYTGPLDVEVAPLHAGGSFELTFNCKPQRFLNSGSVALTFTADGTLPEVDALAGTPVITITGTGTCSIGDTVITITEADGPTIIDCDMMDCYNSEESRNAYVSFSDGRFPQIYPGDGVELGDMTMIEILPRWWRL